MRRVLGPIAVAILLLSPIAGATTAGGLLTVTHFETRAGPTIEGRPLALFATETHLVDLLVLEAPRATVHYFHREYLSHPVLGSVRTDETEPRAFTATNLTLRLAQGDHAGELGAYFRSGGGDLSFAAAATRAVLAPRSETTFGNPYGTEDDPQPGELTYSQTVEGPHVLVEASGLLAYEGAFSLKVRGPDIRATFEEGAATLRTGHERRDQGAYQERIEEWAFVEVPQGTLRASTRGSMAFALRALDLSWSGPAALTIRDGLLESGADAYAGSGPSTLSGSFRAAGLARAAGSEPVLALHVEGTLVSTSMEARGAAVAPAPRGAGAVPWILLAAAVAVAGGTAGAAAIVARRRRPEPALALEECVQRAGIAAENESFVEALQWTDRAIARAPRSARLHADRAFFLARLRRLDEALSAYATAMDLSSDGEAALTAARLLLTEGRPPEETRPWVEAALARSPELVMEMDDAFAPLRTLPWLRQAERRALARLETGDPNG